MNAQLKLWVPIILWLSLGQVLQDVAAGSRPNAATAASSLSDANLMFEILLGGVELNNDSTIFLLDEELASMRKGRDFLFQINHNTPKSLSSVEFMMEIRKAGRETPLSLFRFENLVLSMVYSALQVRVQRSKEEREAWGRVLVQLANVTTYQLRGSFLHQLYLRKP
ncbi:LOW QUALITY PROTEIN: protein FAM180B [Anableps anableps]